MEIITYEVQQNVKVRKYEVDCEKLCLCLREHKSKQKLSNKHIALILDVPVTKVEHWFRKDSSFAIPEPNVWYCLKELLEITTNEFDDSIMTFVEKENVFESANRVYGIDGLAPTITCGSTDIRVLIENKTRSNRMEPVRLGGLYDKETKKHQMGSVWDKNALSPTIDTMQGGYREPMIIEDVKVKVIGQMDNTIDHTFESANRVYDTNGLAPTVNTCGGGGLQPKIIVAMRGRNPDNPSDRTPGVKTEQRLEPNSQGICNTLTSVQKDNLVLESAILTPKRTEYGKTIRKAYESGAIQESRHNMTELQPRNDGITNTLTTVQKDNLLIEKVGIKQATKKGYIECEVGGVADFSFPDSKLRRGRVQEGGKISPTLMAGGNGVCRIEKVNVETYSPYVNKKYEEFQKEHGYIPEFFNPYNKTELSNIVPTLTAQGESITKSGSVLKCDEQYRIRKLTPKECWRLMGFSDEDFHKAEQVNSNTQLYKQAGNSIVVDVLEAIFRNFF